MKNYNITISNLKLAYIFVSSMVLGIVGCSEPEEFSIIPEIKFNDIEFRQPLDSVPKIVLSIDFTDGDGDLGLQSISGDDSPPLDALFPYHGFEVIADGNGQFVTNRSEGTNFPWFRTFPLITNRLQFGSSDTRPNFNCVDYEVGFVNQERTFFTSDSRYTRAENPVELNQAVVYSTVTNVSTIVRDQLMPDTVFVLRNVDRFNILIDYFIKRNGVYEEFDWLTAFDPTGCLGVDYNGRFPILDIENIGTSLEGTLKYAMSSNGFEVLFKTDTLKLRISIKDRALNQSNVIDTPDFTLQGIAKD